ncbi:MAG TPA: hypothetical protein PLJ27_08840 [Polyangiaceae bacterium]|nr:hypothetical protein [Polyangiaceae bacterium]HNZ25130.1 hypothetical protein [Polyangiaceae bacterium]HOD22074.1 hypothetical protein [Polyangiaceae bacterium]HOE51954.1 hypothetical protein [Polyangiaceae bacterium]HOH02064.1 hypothetical protein [Polyangiaceae bacterium]
MSSALRWLACFCVAGMIAAGACAINPQPEPPGVADDKGGMGGSGGADVGAGVGDSGPGDGAIAPTVDATLFEDVLNTDDGNELGDSDDEGVDVVGGGDADEAGDAEEEEAGDAADEGAADAGDGNVLMDVVDS